MYVYFDKSGRLLEIVDEPIRKASLNYSKIYAYIEDSPVFSSLWVSFQSKNESPTTEKQIDNFVYSTIPEVKDRDLKYFEENKTYKFAEITVPTEVLQKNGLTLCTLRGVLADSSIFSFGLITFNVENNIIKNDYNLTQSQYDYLVSLVGSFPTWITIEDFIGVSRAEINEYANYTEYLQNEKFNLSFDYSEEKETINSITYNGTIYYIKDYENDIKSVKQSLENDIDLIKQSIENLLLMNYEVVDELPENPSNGTIYWLKNAESDFSLYIWTDGKYSLLFDHINFDPEKFVSEEELAEKMPTSVLLPNDDGNYSLAEKNYVIISQESGRTSWNVQVKFIVKGLNVDYYQEKSIEMPTFNKFKNFFEFCYLGAEQGKQSTSVQGGSQIFYYEVNGVQKQVEIDFPIPSADQSDAFAMICSVQQASEVRKFNTGVVAVKPYKVFLAYADDEKGTNWTEKYNGQYYIGTYVGNLKPKNASYYTWSKFRGDVITTTNDETTTQIDEEFLNNNEKSFSNSNITSVRLTIPSDAEIGFMSDITIKIDKPTVSFNFVNNSSYEMKILQYGIGILQNFVADKKCLVHIYCHCDGMYSYIYIQEIFN
jgi:hypothetical protein